jgi:hypothetical protein
MTEDGLNGPPTVPEAAKPVAGQISSNPGLLTVSLTSRLVLPLPVVTLTKLMVSL